MTDLNIKKEQISGGEILLKSLIDCGVDTIFGYPGGAVLPIYDALYANSNIKHILTCHEQGAGHAAEGYARSTGKLGVMLVTSGPGITNTITALTDAYLDSIPVLCISGQVPTFMIGTDAFQECDATGLTHSCTKHNFLVKNVEDLAPTIFKAVKIATTGRAGPVLVDIPKDIQLAMAEYKNIGIDGVNLPSYNVQSYISSHLVEKAVDIMAVAKKPIFYTGGGIVNAGVKASELLKEVVELTHAPVTTTLMGLGGFPASDEHFLGMLGMHGTYEANMAMHDCDVMLAIGARFDDRVTGKTDEFSPNSKKIHVDIDKSSINKNIDIDLAIVGNAEEFLAEFIVLWRKKFGFDTEKKQKVQLKEWWGQIDAWRKKESLKYKKSDDIIKPQFAIERLYELTKNRDVYITTEVGQHQMWTAQYFKFEKPNRFMTSGGLGTMGYGFPAAIGVQVAHKDALVIDIAGEASIQMTLQELGTLKRYNLPVKVFILNNGWMGMVRQWQELIHGERYSESSCKVQPDFVKLAEAYGIKGLRARNVNELDGVINEMIEHKGSVFADIVVKADENCFPMIPPGAAHNKMIFADD